MILGHFENLFSQLKFTKICKIWTCILYTFLYLCKGQYSASLSQIHIFHSFRSNSSVVDSAVDGVSESHSNIAKGNDFRRCSILCADEWSKCELDNFNGLRFIPHLTEKLSNLAAYNLVHSSVARCPRVPQRFRRNGIFLINASNVKNLKDIKSDLNGTYQTKMECKRKKVLVTGDQLKVLTEYKQNDRPAADDLVMVVDRYRHFTGLVRSIVYFFVGEERNTIGNACILQYYIDQSIAG